MLIEFYYLFYVEQNIAELIGPTATGREDGTFTPASVASDHLTEVA